MADSCKPPTLDSGGFWVRMHIYRIPENPVRELHKNHTPIPEPKVLFLVTIQECEMACVRCGHTLSVEARRLTLLLLPFLTSDITDVGLKSALSTFRKGARVLHL